LELEQDIGLDAITEDIEEIEDDGFDLPKLAKTIMAFKIVLNLIFVALPWTWFSWLLWVWNIVFNSWLNKGWAEGNFWLLGNTAFATL